MNALYHLISIGYRVFHIVLIHEGHSRRAHEHGSFGSGVFLSSVATHKVIDVYNAVLPPAVFLVDGYPPLNSVGRRVIGSVAFGNVSHKTYLDISIVIRFRNVLRFRCYGVVSVDLVEIILVNVYRPVRIEMLLVYSYRTIPVVVEAPAKQRLICCRQRCREHLFAAYGRYRVDSQHRVEQFIAVCIEQLPGHTGHKVKMDIVTGQRIGKGHLSAVNSVSGIDIYPEGRTQTSLGAVAGAHRSALGGIEEVVVIALRHRKISSMSIPVDRDYNIVSCYVEGLVFLAVVFIPGPGLEIEAAADSLALSAVKVRYREIEGYGNVSRCRVEHIGAYLCLVIAVGINIAR